MVPQIVSQNSFFLDTNRLIMFQPSPKLVFADR
jgi:hypothetical protein